MDKFRGILFLLTNYLPTTLDEAFVSRIHLSVNYKRLTQFDRKRIWNNVFDRIETEKNIRVDKYDRDYLFESREIQVMGWGGRDIENGKH